MATATSSSSDGAIGVATKPTSAAGIADSFTTLHVDDAQVKVANFVADDQPNRWLRCTMSRHVKDDMLAEPHLRPFLTGLLRPDDNGKAVTDDAIQRVAYGTGAKKVLLLEFATVDFATRIKQQLHKQPCDLIQKKIMYIDYALHRKLKEVMHVCAILWSCCVASSRIVLCVCVF